MFWIDEANTTVVLHVSSCWLSRVSSRLGQPLVGSSWQLKRELFLSVIVMGHHGDMIGITNIYSDMLGGLNLRKTPFFFHPTWDGDPKWRALAMTMLCNGDRRKSPGVGGLIHCWWEVGIGDELWIAIRTAGRKLTGSYRIKIVVCIFTGYVLIYTCIYIYIDKAGDGHTLNSHHFNFVLDRFPVYIYYIHIYIYWISQITYTKGTIYYIYTYIYVYDSVRGLPHPGRVGVHYMIHCTCIDCIIIIIYRC